MSDNTELRAAFCAGASWEDGQEYYLEGDAIEEAIQRYPRRVGWEEEPNNHDRGLYDKFIVRRTDGQSEAGGKHANCRYFVLDIDHDPHAVPALRAYAKSCRKDYPALATDLYRTIAFDEMLSPAASQEEATLRHVAASLTPPVELTPEDAKILQEHAWDLYDSAPAASQSALETMPDWVRASIQHRRSRSDGVSRVVNWLADRVAELERENAESHRAYLGEIKLQNEYEGQIHALKSQIATLHSSAAQETTNG